MIWAGTEAFPISCRIARQDTIFTQTELLHDHGIREPLCPPHP